MIVFTVNNSRSLAIGSGALSDAGFVVFFFFLLCAVLVLMSTETLP